MKIKHKNLSEPLMFHLARNVIPALEAENYPFIHISSTKYKSINSV